MLHNVFNDVLTKQGGIYIEGETPVELSYGYDPAITGYIHCYIDGISPLLPAIGKTLEMKKLKTGFPCLARGFTIPEASLNEVDFPGMLNIKETGALVQGTELSVRFIDTSDLALTNFFADLFYTMRPMPLVDANVEAESLHSKLLQASGLDYLFHGTINILMFATDPALDMCTTAVACFGLWPKALPKDHLNVEISQTDLYLFTQNFTIAYTYYNGELRTLGDQVLSMYRNTFQEIK